jgi:hypothetical protein
MRTYKVRFIHPNANAEYTVTVAGKSKRDAANHARELLFRQYGAGHMFFIGEVTKG